MFEVCNDSRVSPMSNLSEGISPLSVEAGTNYQHHRRTHWWVGAHWDQEVWRPGSTVTEVWWIHISGARNDALDENAIHLVWVDRGPSMDVLDLLRTRLLFIFGPPKNIKQPNLSPYKHPVRFTTGCWFFAWGGVADYLWLFRFCWRFYAIHRPTPTFTEMNTTAQQLLTGIKVWLFFWLVWEETKKLTKC